MFFKIVVVRNFTIFTGKHLCWSHLCLSLTLKACNFIKKRLQHKCFPVNIVKFLRTFLIEHLRWLLQKDVDIKKKKLTPLVLSLEWVYHISD